ncbi:LacI family DNA-binding transcriptional regulator [Sporosarcina sp. YIM B06819]|uniref:LacI family DNA-binding transcriptional regulator n=1 Tax=Sporosarcina sp. YIM B06819 TaxID=3081769 RepID=UPI00298C0526|nr:LacI family DNA-binding transcriptional regulator [Sporosarcina sp. YIM B06819]
MSVTIKDVAARAGVAPSTVSRVISDSPHISEKTKRKVHKIMEEMGYHLNYNARNLAQQSTKTIGIVMKNSTEESMFNTFFPEVIRGISGLCSKYDFSISLTTGESEEEIFNDTVKMVRGKRVDGMIVLYSKKDDRVVPYLIESGIPFVVIGKPLIEPGKIMFVDNDNVQATKEATDYLLNIGHTKIAFIGEDTEFEVGEARLNGFSQAMREKHLDIPELYLKNLQPNADHGQQVISELMELADPPTALVVTNDLNALILLTALSEKNIKVPEDMSLISFNNSIISRISNPPLTTVDTQIFQLGYESASCLIELVKDPSIFKKSVVIPTSIVERKSCVAPRI